jgi:hypothetical protein
LTNDSEVVKSIEIMQFIYPKEKGRSFKEIMNNLNDYLDNAR